MQTFNETLETLLTQIPDGYEVSFDSVYKSVTISRHNGQWRIWLGQRFPTMIKTNDFGYASKRIAYYLKIKEVLTNET